MFLQTVAGHNGGNCGIWLQTVYVCLDGTLEAIFRTLSADKDTENLSLDSTCIKVHESANGGKNGG